MSNGDTISHPDHHSDNEILQDVEPPSASTVQNPNALNEVLEGSTQTDVVPFYVGEPHELGSILNLFFPQRPAAVHYHVPRPETRSLSADDAAYLQTKGVYDLPEQGLVHVFIRSFFQYAFIYIPVIDAGSFLMTYFRHGVSAISPLLLWSMFLAAAHYAPMETIRAAGYGSREAMKETTYWKAKHLYDMDTETDKIIVIQAVLLLTFRYGDTQDRCGPSHWLAVATNLCYSIGLHRDPGPLLQHRFTEAQMCLWKRIWWFCMQREPRNSFSYGRPMHIRLEDCNVPAPSAEDLWLTVAALPPSVREEYLPSDLAALGSLYERQLKQDTIMATLLYNHYGIGEPRAAAIEAHERDILGCQEGVADHSKHEDLAVRAFADYVSINHGWVHILEVVHITLLTALSALSLLLYRPYLPRRNGVAASAWQNQLVKKARAAADAMTAIVTRIMTAEQVHLCDVTIVTAIKPATLLYLYLSVMTTGLARKTASHQLELYFLMLSEMRDRSVSAGLLLNLLRKALKLQSEGDRPSHPPLNLLKSTQKAVLDSVGALEDTFLPSQSWCGLAR
ncbi:hypothetical protein LTR41_000001 [Exophiala xenobiotica]|nr:hypothetical protein LTR41_000001 [Exophiala xenobiotica]